MEDKNPNKKSLWATIPGLVAGVAAILTGIVALANLATSHNNHSAASQTPTGGASAPAASSPAPGATATATPSGGPSDTPSPGASGSPTPTPTGPAMLTAGVSSLDLGQATLGQSTSVQTVTITNTGSTPAKLDGVSISPDQSPFSISSSTCGSGTLQPQQTCQVGVHFTAAALGSITATLSVAYEPPSGSAATVTLSGTGAVL
jgi:hypothetical protein